MRLRWLAVLLLGCALSGAAAAQSVNAASAPPAAVAPVPAPAARAPALRPEPIPATMPASPSAGSLMQTIFALTFVLGLLAALGGRERIMVLEVGDQWIVVGASPGRVNALATLPRPEGAPAAAPVPHPDFPTAGSFAAWLKQTIEQRNAK